MTRNRSLLAALALAACSSPSSSGNPATLWLAPDQAETRVKLVASEPPSY